MALPAKIWATTLLGAWLCQGEDNVRIHYDGVSTNLDGVVVGATGTNNSLIIRGGARVAARFGVLGATATAHDNQVLLTDPGSLLELEASLTVGRAGMHNTLTVSNKGSVNAGEVKVGTYEPAKGSGVIVAGAGSRLCSGGDLVLGFYGSGNRLLVAEGGEVSCRQAIVGGRGDSVVVTGRGSSLDVAEVLALGYHETSLTVADGARVSCGSAVLSGPGLRVRVSGPDATWRVRSSLSIRGGGFTNVLTVAGGGSVVVTNQDGTGLLVVESPAGAARRGAGLHLDGGTVVADRFRLTDGWIEGRGLLVGPVTDLVRSSLSVPRGVGGFRVEGNLYHLGTLHIVSGAEKAEGLQVEGDLLHRGLMTFELVAEGRLPGEPLLSVAGALTLPGNNSFLVVTAPPGFRPGWTDAVSLVRWGGRTGQFTNAYHGARLAVGAGSFRVLYTENELQLSDYYEDADKDGMDDLWARTYFGDSPLSAEVKAADKDGDGVSNRDESRAGTDPNDPESRLRILSVAREPGAVRLRFTANPVKWHRVWRSTNLVKWVEVREPKFTRPAPGVFEWVDDADPATPRQLYRVSAQ